MDKNYYLKNIDSICLEKKMSRFAAAMLEADIIRRDVVSADIQLETLNKRLNAENARELQGHIESVTMRKEKAWEDMFEADDILLPMYVSIASHFTETIVNEQGCSEKEVNKEMLRTTVHKDYPGLIDMYDELFEFVDGMYAVLAQ